MRAVLVCVLVVGFLNNEGEVQAHLTSSVSGNGRRPTLCPPEASGSFTYPKDCHVYIKCWRGYGKLEVCPEGQLFDGKKKVCDDWKKVDCAGDADSGYQQDDGIERIRFPGNRPKIAPNPRKVVGDFPELPKRLHPPIHPAKEFEAPQSEAKVTCPPGRTGYFPHPKNCRKFMNCWGGQTFKFECGPGLAYNPLYKVCDYAYKVPLCLQLETEASQQLQEPSVRGRGSPPQSSEFEDRIYSEEPIAKPSSTFFQIATKPATHDSQHPSQFLEPPAFGLRQRTVPDEDDSQRVQQRIPTTETSVKKPTPTFVVVYPTVKTTKVPLLSPQTTPTTIAVSDTTESSLVLKGSSPPLCRLDEVENDGVCYSFHTSDGKRNSAFQSLETCSSRDAHLLDIDTQEEMKFVSEWLVKSAPNATSIMTSGIRIIVMGTPLWIWQSSGTAVRLNNWWAETAEMKAHQDRSKQPYCLVMKREFLCSQKPTVDLRALLRSGEMCQTETFYWDGQLCDSVHHQHLPFVCERSLQIKEESEPQNVTSCSKDEFECPSGGCIGRDRLCDGYMDCAKGADESVCSDFLKEFSHEWGRWLSPGNETWTNSSASACAMRCLEHQQLQCRSFSYNENDRTCSLSDRTLGITLRSAPQKHWSYYKRKTVPWPCGKNQFTCQSGDCVETSKVCDGVPNCADQSDEAGCTRKTLEIRFSGTSDTHEGYLVLKVSDKWTPYCSSNFNQELADVACRQLNFPLGAAEYFPHVAEDEETEVIPACDGSETSLDQCWLEKWPNNTCSQAQFVFLTCRKLEEIITNAPMKPCEDGLWQCSKTKECIRERDVCNRHKDCKDGSDEDAALCKMDIRLANGPNETSGRVEVKRLGVWGTICDDDISDQSADVICRSLGLGSSVALVKEAGFGPGSDKMWLVEVKCKGEEKSLEECRFSTEAERWCKHSEDIGVVCNPSSVPKVTESPMSTDVQQKTLNPFERLERSMYDECGDTEETPKVGLSLARILDQHSIPAGSVPWQASVRIVTGPRTDHFCGAVIISVFHVLTVAHCVTTHRRASYFVRVGDHDTEIKDADEMEFPIDRLYVHKNFSKGHPFANDIALIKIKGEIKIGATVRPACMVPTPSAYKPSLNCSISGWGWVSSNSAGFSRLLHRGYVPLLSSSVCQAPHIYGGNITNGMICAGDLKGGVDACHGDSGGPLTCPYQGKAYLFGLTSWGYNCGEPERPGVYTNIAYFSEWIQRTIAASMQ